jgi:hypothetical protein
MQDQSNSLSGYFVRKYGPLRGSDWLKRLPEDERQALAQIAHAASGYGRYGGMARARTAQRDSRGRFRRNDERR